MHRESVLFTFPFYSTMYFIFSFLTEFSKMYYNNILSYAFMFVLKNNVINFTKASWMVKYVCSQEIYGGVFTKQLSLFISQLFLA